MYPLQDYFYGQPRWKVLYLRLHFVRRQVRRGRVCCNAVKTDFFGGIKSRAEGFSPLIIPTLCRGSAAVSGERARSCRCPRAGRKPGITMAESFISTTTPGKLHGLTPEIGMLKAWEHWDYTHSHKVTLIHQAFLTNYQNLARRYWRRCQGGPGGGGRRLQVEAVLFCFCGQGSKLPPFPLT